MRERRHQSRSAKARGLHKVTLYVPDGCAGILRQFARELCARQANGPTGTMPNWRKLSLSAELMIDPDCGARCAVRDTRGDGASRYQWSVMPLGMPDPVAEGCAADRAEARSLAEAALRNFFKDWREQPSRAAMTDIPQSPVSTKGLSHRSWHHS